MERDPHGNAHGETEHRKRLMALMTRHQRQIFSYIYVLVPNRSDAEDFLQETSLVICEKFHEFRPGTEFVAWACQIAYWRVRDSRQKSARSTVVLDPQIHECLAQTGREAWLWKGLARAVRVRCDYVLASGLTAHLCDYGGELQTGEPDGSDGLPAHPAGRWVIALLSIAAYIAVIIVLGNPTARRRV